ncbi:hypothetical protein GCM10009555_039190 [Acrocarpospora macrocephala]|uniref:Uncharacterized protein n=1 Tax=Acrocarpospora macrocephala TaxID=150177 RepID=A0A5M3WKN1_9ACTN|nr:DUF6069 family protein [Acrocarpospora macrocephala]GES09805.1 hypothetical protein Amac_034010 [Acrocarpospora macrocephala]
MNKAHVAPTEPTVPGAVEPRRLLIAATAAVVVDLLVFWIGSAAGASLKIEAPYELNALVVALATAVPMLAAGAVVWLVARRLPGVRRWAAWVGLAFALVSALMPFVVSADVATGVTLALMHGVAGTAWVVALLRHRPRALTR